MTSALDIVGHNPALQEHWLRRLIAVVIDALIVFVVAALLNAAFGIFAWPAFLWLLLAGLIWVLYAVITEAGWGTSVGKRIVKLKVVGIDAPMNVEKALVRNVSKLHPILLGIDALLGFVTSGDPRQRYLDRLARTTPARSDPQAYLEEQFRPMQHQPPHPIPPPAAAWGQPVAAAGAAPAAAPSPGPTPATGGWPGEAPREAGSGWPQHEWDAQGALRPQTRFCMNCGGELVARGDGKLTCVRCGAVY